MLAAEESVKRAVSQCTMGVEKKNAPVSPMMHRSTSIPKCLLDSWMEVEKCSLRLLCYILTL